VIRQGIIDVRNGLQHIGLPIILSWHDVLQRYRRSALGPFWLTLSMAIMIGTIAAVFGGIFNVDLYEFLPFVTVGYILWAFFQGIMTDGCQGFIAAEGIIKQLPLPLSVHVLRVVIRNGIAFLHNIVIVPIVFLITQHPISSVAFLSVLGLVFFILNLFWITLLLSTVCARFRDLSQIITSALQIVFYATPIMWMPSFITNEKLTKFLKLNPLFHLMELVRAPLLGIVPSLENWIFASTFLIVGWAFTLAFFGRFRKRVPYWV
jgi:ABC-type polysaccharide/polyol phosphate export permease